jgi:D-xylonolactonase
MGEKNVMGGLFRVEAGAGQGGGLRVRNLFKGTGCANGMGWSPDLKRMYWTCSSRNLIYVYDYDAVSGEMRNEQLFHQADRTTAGTCDGLAVDSEGNVYSARWGGSAIYKFDASGKLVGRIEVPTLNVTSLCFGGKDLRDVYVSTAAAGKDEPGAGGLYHFRSEVPGQYEFRSRLAVG